MNLEALTVDSIKERIVRSVWALGPLATKAAIGKAVVCDSSVLAIGIEGLHRDGYLYICDAGHYRVADQYVATLPSLEPAIAIAATATSPQPQPATGVAMAKTKICNKCEAPKDAEKDFYTGCAQCKRCVLDRQIALKAAKKAGVAPPPASAKPARHALRATITKVAKPQPDELIIPAAGEIRCRIFDAGAGPAYSLHQGEDQLTLSREQLQALHGWAGAVLKA